MKLNNVFAKGLSYCCCLLTFVLVEEVPGCSPLPFYNQRKDLLSEQRDWGKHKENKRICFISNGNQITLLHVNMDQFTCHILHWPCFLKAPSSRVWLQISTSANSSRLHCWKRLFLSSELFDSSSADSLWFTLSGEDKNLMSTVAFSIICPIISSQTEKKSWTGRKM